MIKPLIRNSKMSGSGMTLIEVIVSLAIFSFIAVAFFGMFSTVFINMYKTSEITENAFYSQQLIEEQIASVKSKLEEGLIDEITLTPVSMDVFTGAYKRTIETYNVSQTLINGKTIETSISQIRPPKLRVPVINSNIVLSTFNGANKTLYPNASMINSLSVTLEGGTPSVDNPGLLIQFVYYWYISKPGVYTAYQPPIFPDDYEILVGYTNKDIPNLNETFVGRFLKLAVTPIGEKGAMGITEFSNDVYISPLSYVDTLIIHKDASRIQIPIGTVETTEVLLSNYIYNLKNWLDISTTSHPTGTIPSIKPTLVLETIHGQTEQSQIFKVTNTNTTSTVLQTLKKGNSETSVSNATIYLVANFDAILSRQKTVTLLTSNGSNSSNKFILRTKIQSSTDTRLELIRYYNNQNTSRTILSKDDISNGIFEVYKLEIYDSGISIKDGLILSGSTYTFENSQSIVYNNSSSLILTPLNSTFNIESSISEILIYSSKLSPDNEAKVLKYLFEKYKPQ